jgi:hypothetical protein
MTKQNSDANGSSEQPVPDWARQAGEYLRARQLATQAQLAPLATSARIAAAQRMLLARAPRRRWPAVVGGVVVIVGGAAAAAIILNRRNSAAVEAGEPDETATAPDTPQDMTAADTVSVDVNGQTQAPRP